MLYTLEALSLTFNFISLCDRHGWLVTSLIGVCVSVCVRESEGERGILHMYSYLVCFSPSRAISQYMCKKKFTQIYVMNNKDLFDLSLVVCGLCVGHTHCHAAWWRAFLEYMLCRLVFFRLNYIDRLDFLKGHQLQFRYWHCNSALDGFQTTLEDFFSINRGWGGGGDVTHLLAELHWLPVKLRLKYKLATLAFRCFSCTISLSSLLGIYQSSRCLAQPVMRNTQPTEELVQKNLDQRSSRSVPVRLFVWRSFPVGIWMPEPTQFTRYRATGMLTYASILNISQRIYIHNWRTIISLLHALTAYTYTRADQAKMS